MAAHVFEGTEYQITIDGTDYSSRFTPLLIGLSVTLYDGGQADAVEIELDDTFGQIALPRVGAPVSIALGGTVTGAAAVFDGFTDEPKAKGPQHEAGGMGASGEVGELLSAGNRSQGRVLSLSAKAINTQGALKAPQEDNLDNGTFSDAANKFAKTAGLSGVVMAGALAAIKRPYWSIGKESFMAWGMRMARENGATFKIIGGQAIFVPRSGGVSASGQALGGITAAWGDNLLDWSVTPLQSRPVFANFRVPYYDVQAAEWKVKTAGASGAIGSDFVADHTARMKGANADQAQVQADSNAAEAAREKGAADHVVIVGDAAAQPEAPCTLVGIRDGVDGAYTISRVRHDLRRGQGFISQLGLKQPSGSAGVDSR